MRRLVLIALALIACGPASADMAGELRLAPGEPLTAPSLRELVLAALPPADPGRRIELELSSPRLPLDNASAHPVTLRLRELRVDEGRRRLTGELTVAVNGTTTGTVPVAGSLRTLVEVPVPVQTVPGGRALVPGDLGTAWIVEQQLRPDIVMASTEVVGREAERRLPPGRPIRAADLRTPRLVRKGELVTIVYRGRGLELTARGKALEDGGEGEPVRIVNLDSDRPLRAVVIDRKHVAVITAEGTP